MVAVPPPDDPPVLAPARNEGALGLGYYIPPGFREFVRNVKPLAESLNLPYNLVAGTGRKTRDALDSSLPIEERIRKGGEAAIETGIQAILPFFGRFAGQPLSRAVVESFFPVSTPKSAAEAAVDTVENMGRRNMLKGAAAATGVAALLPEAFIEATSKVPAAVTKTAAKAAVINPINMAAENIRLLKKQIDEADELRDEILEQVGEGAEASAQQSTIYNTQDEIFDVVRDTLEEFEPEDYVQASDEALEELAKYNYDLGNLYGGVNYYSIDTSNFKNLANEAKRRGLHKLKNEKGITQFPNISALVEELDEKAFEQLQNLTLPNTALKMTDDSGKSTEQLIKELGEDAFKSQYEFVKRQLEMETDLSPEEIDRIARINASRKGRNMEEGGVVSNNEDPSKASESQKNLANKLIDAAISAEGVRAEAKQKFIEGNYAEGIAEYLIGLGGSIPVYKQINAGIGQALREADNQGDYSFGNVLKNLLNPNNSISFVTEKLGLKEGGVVSFAPYLR